MVEPSVKTVKTVKTTYPGLVPPAAGSPGLHRFPGFRRAGKVPAARRLTTASRHKIALAVAKMGDFVSARRGNWWLGPHRTGLAEQQPCRAALPAFAVGTAVATVATVATVAAVADDSGVAAVAPVAAGS